MLGEESTVNGILVVQSTHNDDVDDVWMLHTLPIEGEVSLQYNCRSSVKGRLQHLSKNNDKQCCCDCSGRPGSELAASRIFEYFSLNRHSHKTPA